MVEQVQRHRQLCQCGVTPADAVAVDASKCVTECMCVCVVLVEQLASHTAPAAALDVAQARACVSVQWFGGYTIRLFARCLSHACLPVCVVCVCCVWEGCDGAFFWRVWCLTCCVESATGEWWWWRSGMRVRRDTHIHT